MAFAASSTDERLLAGMVVCEASPVGTTIETHCWGRNPWVSWHCRDHSLPKLEDVSNRHIHGVRWSVGSSACLGHKSNENMNEVQI